MFNQIIFLSIVASIGVISASLCAPALPFIADHFSTHFSHLQFTISLFLVGNAFGQFLSGPLSDQIGQRTVLLGGLLLYILASCGCAVSEQMNVLITWRFFQGMGSSVGPVLARAITSSNYPPERSAQIQSYGAIGIGIASILAIITSGQLTLISWRWNFWLAASLGGILLAWAYVTLKNTSLQVRGISFKQIFSLMKQVFIHPQFIAPTFYHSITYGLMYGYIALFPFLFVEYFSVKNPVQVGIYSAYMIAFYMFGAFLASRLVTYWNSGRLITFGLILQLLSGWLLFFSSTFSFLIAALFLFNFSIGVILPMTVTNALRPFVGQQAVGTASSCLGLSYRLIGSILSAAICQFPLIGGKNLGLAMILLSTLCLVLNITMKTFVRSSKPKIS